MTTTSSTWTMAALLLGAGSVSRAAEDTPQADAADVVPITEEAQRSLQQATRALAASRPDEATQALDRVETALPQGSWALPMVRDLRAVAERLRLLPANAGTAGGASPSLHLDDASLEDIATMYTHLTIEGVWTGAWIFGILAEADEDRVIPLSVLTGGVGVGIAYVLDHRPTRLTGGTAAAVNFGLQYGTAQATLLLLSVDAWESMSDKAAASVMWCGGVLGGVLGGMVAEQTGATRGQLALIYSGALWGAALGLTTALTLELENGTNVAQVVQAGSLVGAAATAYTGTQIAISRSRSLFIDLGGLSGVLVGGALLAMIKPDSATASGGILTATIAGGLGLATHLTREMDSAPSARGRGTASLQITPMWLAPVGDAAGGRPPVPGIGVWGAL